MALEDTPGSRAVLEVSPTLQPSGCVVIWGTNQDDPEICILFLNRNLWQPFERSLMLGILQQTDRSSLCFEGRVLACVCGVSVDRLALSQHFAAVIHVTFHFKKWHFFKTLL